MLHLTNEEVEALFNRAAFSLVVIVFMAALCFVSSPSFVNALTLAISQ